MYPALGSSSLGVVRRRWSRRGPRRCSPSRPRLAPEPRRRRYPEVAAPRRPSRPALRDCTRRAPPRCAWAARRRAPSRRARPSGIGAPMVKCPYEMCKEKRAAAAEERLPPRDTSRAAPARVTSPRCTGRAPASGVKPAHRRSWAMVEKFPYGRAPFWLLVIAIASSVIRAAVGGRSEPSRPRASSPSVTRTSRRTRRRRWSSRRCTTSRFSFNTPTGGRCAADWRTPSSRRPTSPTWSKCSRDRWAFSRTRAGPRRAWV